MAKQDMISVMVVDDDPLILETITIILEEKGFEVNSASSGEDAILLLEKFKPNIILLDVTMPKMDGFETCKVLKGNKDTRGIPVIFLTGMGSGVEMKLQSLMVGAVDYISKPYSGEDLIAIIKKHNNTNQEGS